MNDPSEESNLSGSDDELSCVTILASNVSVERRREAAQQKERKMQSAIAIQSRKHYSGGFVPAFSNLLYIVKEVDKEKLMAGLRELSKYAAMSADADLAQVDQTEIKNRMNKIMNVLDGIVQATNLKQQQPDEFTGFYTNGTMSDSESTTESATERSRINQTASNLLIELRNVPELGMDFHEMVCLHKSVAAELAFRDRVDSVAKNCAKLYQLLDKPEAKKLFMCILENFTTTRVLTSAECVETLKQHLQHVKRIYTVSNGGRGRLRRSFIAFLVPAFTFFRGAVRGGGGGTVGTLESEWDHIRDQAEKVLTMLDSQDIDRGVRDLYVKVVDLTKTNEVQRTQSGDSSLSSHSHN